NGRDSNGTASYTFKGIEPGDTSYNVSNFTDRPPLSGTITKSWTEIDPLARMLYNGNTKKENTYKSEVDLSASGLKLSLSANGPFTEHYILRTSAVGTGDISKQFYFKDDNSGIVSQKPYTVSVNLSAGDPISVSVDAYKGYYDGVSHNAVSTLTVDGTDMTAAGATSGRVERIAYGIDGEALTTTIPTITDAGTYSIEVYIIGKGNYENKFITLECEVYQRQLAASMVELDEEASLVSGKAEPEPVVTYNGETLTRGEDYTVSYSNNTTVGETGTATITGIGNFTGSVERKFKISIYDPDITLLYNGDDEKESWYNDAVEITADGFKVSDSASEGFNSSYSITGSGKNVSKVLYFKNIDKGLVKSTPVTVTVNIDKDAPSAKIKVEDDYSTKKLETSDDPGLYINESRDIEISASDKLSGVDTIAYFCSDEQYTNESKLLKVADGKWKTYNKKKKPTLKQNEALFVYACVTDVAGNVKLIGTRALIYDTIKPLVKDVKPDESGSNVEVTVKGSDELSGIDSYYAVAIKSGESAPDAKAVVSGGTKSKTEKVVLKGLTGGQKYTIYAVIKDKAGNISEVKSKDYTAPSSIGGGGADASSSSTDASKAAADKASNGAAGGSDAKKKDSASSDKAKKGDSSDIKGKPYIDDATGNVETGKEKTSGWSKIEEQINNAAAGDKIEVDMSGETVLPKSITSAMSGKDVTVTFKLVSGALWKINGKNISSDKSALKDVDLGVKKNDSSIPEDDIIKLADVYPHTELTLKHDGDFGFKATLMVEMDKSNAGMGADLYYYNKEGGKLEKTASSEVNDAGLASFDFEHASEYTVILHPLSRAVAEETEETTVNAITNEGNTASTAGSATIRKYSTAGKLFSARIWIFVIAFLSAGGCIAVLFIPSMREMNVGQEGEAV
ncbi:MAG: hypothetical protein K6F99_03125, partial [Lachnospiraceae bacterium]|nr:hypothetical protein [Lachnospiraceae bacterium]